MIARHARDIAKKWVMEEGSQVPGFFGAFFHGSINWLPDEAALPTASDIDVMIVLDRSSPPEKPGKFLYQGVIIEATYLPVEHVQSAEQVLGLSHLAGSLRGNSIITDPTGHLYTIQVGVSCGYAKRKWVLKRCEHAEQKVLQHLQSLDKAAFFHDQVIAWLFGVGVTTHILLVAGLKNPTVRKRYLAVRELLAEYGQIEFYEILLEMLGAARMSQARVEHHLVGLETVFDAALEIIRSPFPFAADISQLARPVAINGSRQLIERGDHQEAVFWIAVTYSRCQKVLFQDGPAGSSELYGPGYQALLADLGIQSSTDLQQRCQQVRDMLPSIWQVANFILDTNPEITI